MHRLLEAKDFSIVIVKPDVKTTAANVAETKESVIASAMEVKAARIVIINNSRFVLCHCPFVIGYVV